VRTNEHAKDPYPANAEGWGTAIQLLHELATEKDVKRLNAYCENNKYDKYLGDDGLEIYKLGVMRSKVSAPILSNPLWD
jgi:hypothetical protein